MVRAVRGAVSVLVLVGSALLGAGVLAGPAAADVTVTPGSATRGDAAKITFRVTGDRPGAYTTKVQLLLPDAMPIAEVYPMSVADWAPQATTRSIPQSLDGLHHGQVTEVVSQITWIRVTPAGPQDSAELAVSMGPLPQADRLVFTVVQTYSDGAVERWDGPPAGGGAAPSNPAPVLNLVQPAGAPGEPDQAPEAPPGDGPGWSVPALLGIGLAGGLIAGLIVVVQLRRRGREGA